MDCRAEVKQLTPTAPQRAPNAPPISEAPDWPTDRLAGSLADLRRDCQPDCTICDLLLHDLRPATCRPAEPAPAAPASFPAPAPAPAPVLHHCLTRAILGRRRGNDAGRGARGAGRGMTGGRAGESQPHQPQLFHATRGGGSRVVKWRLDGGWARESTIRGGSEMGGTGFRAETDNPGGSEMGCRLELTPPSLPIPRNRQ